MQCQRCDATNPEGAGFCATCGTALVAGTAATPAPTPPAAPAAPAPAAPAPAAPAPAAPVFGAAADTDRTVARDPKLADILGGQPAGTAHPTEVPGGEAPPAAPSFEPAAPGFEAPAWGAPPAAAPTAPAFEQPPAGPAWQSSPPPPAPAWQSPPPPPGPEWGQQPPAAPGAPWQQPPAAGYAPPGAAPGWAQTPPPQPGWQGGGGYGPPGAAGAFGGGGYGTPTGQLAEWGPRALAYLIDGLLAFAAFAVLAILAVAIHPLYYVSFLATAGVSAWFGYQVGVSGSSPGMRVMGLRCVSQQNGQPIGAGRGILRWLVHFVDGLLGLVLIGGLLELVNLLFPLWDGQKQTLGDKFAGSVVVTAPKRGFSLVPPAG